MAETVFVQPDDIGTFLGFIAGFMCYAMNVPEKKAVEMAPVVDAAIALGLLLAKRQPQLVDACVRHWNCTYPSDADEHVDMMLDAYKGLARESEEVMPAKSRYSIFCYQYEEAEKAAKEAWEKLKKAAKKRDKETLREAMKDYHKAMKLVKKTWLKLEIEVSVPPSEIAYLSGHSQGKEIAQRSKLLTDNEVSQIAVDRGNQVGTMTSYKTFRRFGS